MGKITNVAYTLALKEAADIEGFPCEETYTIKGDGIPMLDVTFGFAVESITGKNYAVGARVESVGFSQFLGSTFEFFPEDLPFIFNGFQLIGIVNQVVVDNMGENEFTACAFYTDDECSEQRELPINFNALTN